MPQAIKHFWVWLLALLSVLIAQAFTEPADFPSTGALLSLAGRLTGISGLFNCWWPPHATAGF